MGSVYIGFKSRVKPKSDLELVGALIERPYSTAMQ